MKLTPKPNRNDIAEIVAVVLNHENFTVYSTCIISHTNTMRPNTISMKPRTDNSADILSSPNNPRFATLHRSIQKRLNLDIDTFFSNSFASNINRTNYNSFSWYLKACRSVTF